MPNRSKVIGIFQGEWPYQIHTHLLVKKLIAWGFRVELFLYETTEYVSPEDNPEGVVIRKFSKPKEMHGFPLSRVRAVCERVLFEIGSPYGLVPKEVLRATKGLDASRFDCVIGVEKLGLIWAHAIAHKKHVPILYYNLELYTWEHPSIATRRAMRIKRAEQSCHRECSATIIQDPKRAQVLFSDHKIENQPCWYLPVSLPGPALKRAKRSHSKLTILYYGKLDRDRYTEELVTLAKAMPREFELHLHGWGPEEFLSNLQERCRREGVGLTCEHKGLRDLEHFVSGFDIGLVLYDGTYLNNRLTSFASEKLAMFLRASIPVVAFRYPGYEIVEQVHAGVLIEKLEELPRALEVLSNNLKKFQEGARQCFLQHYEFHSAIAPIEEKLMQLQGSGAAIHS